MDLLQLVDFHAIATHGGFSAASRVTGVPKATMSRRIRALERDLGVRLLERGPRALSLTDEGEALRRRTAQALAELSEAAEEIAARAGRPRGRLRLSVPGLFAQQNFGAFAARFAAAYPEIALEVSVSDKFVDPIAEGFDVVVRVNPSPDSGLVGQRLFEENFIVAARSDVPRPGASDDCVPAVVLTARPDGEAWTYDDGTGSLVTVQPRAVLRLASMVLICDAVLAGAGAALIPENAAAPLIAAGRLEAWGKLSGRTVGMWVLCPSTRLRSAKVEAMVNLLVETYGR